MAKRYNFSDPVWNSKWLLLQTVKENRTQSLFYSWDMLDFWWEVRMVLRSFSQMHLRVWLVGERVANLDILQLPSPLITTYGPLALVFGRQLDLSRYQLLQLGLESMVLPSFLAFSPQISDRLSATAQNCPNWSRNGRSRYLFCRAMQLTILGHAPCQVQQKRDRRQKCLS